MTLINPQGVKLNIYKQKVEQAIKSYEKWVLFLAALNWLWNLFGLVFSCFSLDFFSPFTWSSYLVIGQKEYQQ